MRGRSMEDQGRFAHQTPTPWHPERAHVPPQVTGAQDLSRNGIAKLVGVRTDVSDWFRELHRRRVERRILPVIALAHGVKPTVQEGVHFGILSEKTLLILVTSDAPRKSVMLTHPEPVEFLGHVPIRSVLAAEQLPVRRKTQVVGISDSLPEDSALLDQEFESVRQHQTRGCGRNAEDVGGEEHFPQPGEGPVATLTSP